MVIARDAVTDARRGGLAARTPTGADYVQRLRDDRLVYFEGELVPDVTTHPGFAPTVQSLARLYDALHDATRRDALTFVTSRGTRSHRSYQPARSSEDLLAIRDAIAEWARLNHGILPVGPDGGSGLVRALSADADFYGDYAANVRRWSETATDGVLHLDLSLAGGAPGTETGLHVVKERAGGIVLRGRRLVSPGAAFSDVIFVSHHIPVSGLSQSEASLAFSFFLRLNSRGAKLIGREAGRATEGRLETALCGPRSGAEDEASWSLVCDDVVVPWEDVCAYRMPEEVNSLSARGLAQQLALHSCTRAGVRMDLLCGLLLKAAELTGADQALETQIALGEAIGIRHAVWALSTAMCAEPMPVPDGGPLVQPNLRYALQWRNTYEESYRRIRGLLRRWTIGDAFEQAPSLTDCLTSLVHGIAVAEQRGGSEMGRRGDLEASQANLIELLRAGESLGDNRGLKDLVDVAMADGNVEGWVDGTSTATGQIRTWRLPWTSE